MQIHTQNTDFRPFPPIISLSFRPFNLQPLSPENADSIKIAHYFHGFSSCIPLHELLLLSPPVRKSKIRLSNLLEMADDGVEPRRRYKTRGSSNGVPLPRNLWWSRRTIEHEESEFVQVDEVVKPRKRRQSGKSR